jgi:uncharacterized protein (TIGR00375 family)
MKYIADFHIHSKYSRATSKSLDLENLTLAAQLKGITVVGTGDFTHPGWLAEIEAKLEPAEPGLFKLKPSLLAALQNSIPAGCRSEVRFILTTEISNIYKKDGHTRKNHNLIFLPDLASVRSFNATLEKKGNIRSDGRPILGISAKHLLEVLLDTHTDGFLVPAHIWTPWFSLLGSKSGFDSLHECFEELSPEIFAAETGLSSDPAMNWRISELDRLTLISNSDAHSTQKMGREANLFDTERSYPAIKAALKNKASNGFKGTIEFYPEEGKYHLDGHRKCNIRFWPKETRSCEGICPVCNKPLTCGVLYRVEEIADRPEGYTPKTPLPFYSLIPLHEILSEILGVGPNSLRVQRTYRMLLEKFGSEFAILHDLDPNDLKNSGVPLLEEAVRRMRRGEIERSPGYDGEFGRINVFNAAERECLQGQKSLFRLPAPPPHKEPVKKTPNQTASSGTLPEAGAPGKTAPPDAPAADQADSMLDCPQGADRGRLNPDQRLAVEQSNHPILVVAGPGTGKTLTLTHRIAFLIAEKHVSASNILAITFTNKAAEQMRQRLSALLPRSSTQPTIATFHALCWSILNQEETAAPLAIVDDFDQNQFLIRALKSVQLRHDAGDESRRRLFQKIIRAKQHILSPQDLHTEAGTDATQGFVAHVYRKYQQLLSIQNLCDYEDLIYRVVRRFETDTLLRQSYQQRYQHVLVDEYQDLNQGQFRLLKQLSPHGRNLFAIGDPDQSIYAFRGSDVALFERFQAHFPGARIFRLQRNYRSSQTILNASHQVINAGCPSPPMRSRIYSGISGIPTVCILRAASERAEAVAIGKMVEKLIGGLGFFSIDYGRVDGCDDPIVSGFADIAVLYRTRAQGELIARTLIQAGIPCRVSNREQMAVQGERAVILAALRVIEGFGSYLDFQRTVTCSGIAISARGVDRFIEWGLHKGLSLKQALVAACRFPLRGLKKSEQLNLTHLARHIETRRQQQRKLDVAEKLRQTIHGFHPSVFDNFPNIEAEAAELMPLATASGKDVTAFFSAAALRSDTDLYDPHAEAVTLMTIHAAKGLEFSVVFVAGCEDGYLPIESSQGRVRDMEEERRLFYVAMTRAKYGLYLCYAQQRRLYGKRLDRRPSPFLLDIQNQLKTLQKTGKNFHRSSPDPQKQLPLF